MASRQGWEFASLEECQLYYQFTFRPGRCNVTWDGFLCWESTAAGRVASQPCPENVKGILRGKSATRTCSSSGFWLDEQGQEADDPSWTNFTGCFQPEFTKVIEGFYANISETEAETKAAIVANSRTLEMALYSISLVSILASLTILSVFRRLRTREKRIHRQLYLAMLIQVCVRLTLYTDQWLSRGDKDNAFTIENTPYLCEAFYVLLEYARTAMFHWFFIEGLHLHNVLTIDVFPTHSSHRWYYVIGWGLPVLMTTCWAVATANVLHTACWYGYSHMAHYYIVEGPRLAVIVINILFLLNILRVLCTKLKNVDSGETDKVRRAVRAALFLQPLLGITNSLQMMTAPYDQSIFYFGLWSYGTTVIVSLQGFFAALFYCFLNGEVLGVLRHELDRLLMVRAVERRASQIGTNFQRESRRRRRNNNNDNHLLVATELDALSAANSTHLGVANGEDNEQSHSRRTSKKSQRVTIAIPDCQQEQHGEETETNFAKNIT